MTGLDLSRDALIEVAVVVTDGDLNVCDEGIDLLIRPDAAALEQMNDFVRTMHTKSGLLTDLEKATLTMDKAEQIVLSYLKDQGITERKTPLAGNTIGTDRAFLARDMPHVESFLHYRNVDVSSIKELAKRWYPKAAFNAPAKHGNHRALADILESIEELRYYRECLFVAQPGPDSDQARAIAQRHEGSLLKTRESEK